MAMLGGDWAKFASDGEDGGTDEATVTLEEIQKARGQASQVPAG